MIHKSIETFSPDCPATLLKEEDNIIYISYRDYRYLEQMWDNNHIPYDRTTSPTGVLCEGKEYRRLKTDFIKDLTEEKIEELVNDYKEFISCYGK